MSRQAFEDFMRWSRAGKGASRAAAMFDRHPDRPDEYASQHVQRHWWTWQNAQKAPREDPEKTETRG